MKKDEFSCWLPGLLVNPSPSSKLTPEKVAMRLAVNWPLSMSEFSMHFSPNGSSGRTCQELLLRTEEETSVSSSACLGNAGMGGPIESLTLDTSESPNVAEESSLSDILEEIGDVPQQCFLTDHNKQRIAQRLAKYGKSLPEAQPGTVWGWSGDETPKFAEGCSPTLRASQGGEGVGVWFPAAGDGSPSANGND